MSVPRSAALLCVAILTAIAPLAAQETSATAIPLPEHPRPDLERAQWQNLNGRWDFAFDAANEGERAGWTRGALPSPRKILVPFSWGSALSGVRSRSVNRNPGTVNPAACWCSDSTNVAPRRSGCHPCSNPWLMTARTSDGVG